MLIHILILLFAALLIYFSCELFVNGIEWVGRKFNISDNAVGTVLAALGTALPEGIVTFIAVVFGTSASQKDIGVGAALGGPLILSTIAYAVVGWCIMTYSITRSKETRLNIDGGKLGSDQLWFLCIFAFNAILGSTVFAGKAYASFLLLAAYGFYCYKEIRSEGQEKEAELLPLKLRPQLADPGTGWVLFQTIAALVLIFIGSNLFVSRLEFLSSSFGLPSHTVALFLSPIATELPETLNAIIWVRQGKIALALSNVSGSMMIQATVPSALGILFTPWLFDGYLYLAVATTSASILFLWLTLKRDCFSARRLAFAFVFYLFFAAGAYLIS